MMCANFGFAALGRCPLWVKTGIPPSTVQCLLSPAADPSVQWPLVGDLFEKRRRLMQAWGVLHRSARAKATSRRSGGWANIPSGSFSEEAT
jgi:hypothetical protein